MANMFTQPYSFGKGTEVGDEPNLITKNGEFYHEIPQFPSRQFQEANDLMIVMALYSNLSSLSQGYGVLGILKYLVNMCLEKITYDEQYYYS